MKIPIADQYGTVWIHLLPFIRPAAVRRVFEDESDLITDVQSAVRAVISHMEIDPNERNILVAHQFVTGASRCESEDIQVGGLDNIDASVFEAFDYTALGHIHSPQNVGKGMVRYCGTPLKYSFSETDQEKSVTDVEMEKRDVKDQTSAFKTISGYAKAPGNVYGTDCPFVLSGYEL